MNTQSQVSLLNSAQDLLQIMGQMLAFGGSVIRIHPSSVLKY